MGRPAAFVLLGGLRVIVRNWLYLTELERRGLTVLVITSADWRDETARCMASRGSPGALIGDAAFVDGSVKIDGSFTPGVVAQMRRWASRYDIVGVFAVGEMLVEQTGIVADALGLPSPGLRAARICRSKYLQRFYLPEWSPRTVIVPPSARRSPDLGGMAFPAVLKPSGRRSSSGVRTLSSSREFGDHVAEYAETETLLVEEYVHGREFSVESLVQHGRIVFESVTRKRTNEAHTDRFVELGHSVPSPGGPGHAELLAANRAIIERLGFADGVTHAELRLADAGEVVLMEIAARTPGDGLLPLYHLATGAPMEPEIIRIALGEPARYPEARRYARQVYLEHRPGVLADVLVHWPGVEPVWVGQDRLWPTVTPGEPGDAPALRDVLVQKSRGSTLGELRESDDRAVAFLIDADSPAELDDLERHVRAAIEVVVTEPAA
jgi:hypothetical protein